MNPIDSLPTRKVFVSYSHDCQDHLDRVLKLANTLRTHGLDASLDQYVQSPEEGWLTWMRKEIEAADYVLLVCTMNYHARLEKNEDPGEGRGAMWEGQLIYHDLYRLRGKNSKYIPVTMEHADRGFIPSILGAATFYNLENDRDYWHLYAYLTGQQVVEKPPLGSIQTRPPRTAYTLPPFTWSSQRLSQTL